MVRLGYQAITERYVCSTEICCVPALNSFSHTRGLCVGWLQMVCSVSTSCSEGYLGQEQHAGSPLPIIHLKMSNKRQVIRLTLAGKLCQHRLSLHGSILPSRSYRRNFSAPVSVLPRYAHPAAGKCAIVLLPNHPFLNIKVKQY